MKFPSSERAEALRTPLNESGAFRNDAAAWEADLLLLVRTPGSPDPAPGLRLLPVHAECPPSEFPPDAGRVAAQFIFEGTAQNRSELSRRERDPVRPFVDGTFTVRGNRAKALRFTRAAKELVETASRIPDGD